MKPETRYIIIAAIVGFTAGAIIYALRGVPLFPGL
jgi:hypothetical protein